jgi:predicted nucleotidyltransferase
MKDDGEPFEETRSMMGREDLKEKREDILSTAAKYGAHNVRVFGSLARGEADQQSDIDFLVEMVPCGCGDRKGFESAHSRPGAG